MEFAAELWIWQARQDETWTFVSLPEDASEDIRELTDGARRGFGSVRVRVLLGTSTWTTSIFPSQDVFVLPVKKAVRKAQGLQPGDLAQVSVELLDF